jgi:hypothetical protein
MSRYPDNAFAVVGNSVRIAVGNTQCTASLPTDAAGNPARCVLITAAGAVNIRFGAQSSVVSSTSTGCLIASGQPYVFKTIGQAFIAAITDTTTSINLTAVEI